MKEMQVVLNKVDRLGIRADEVVFIIKFKKYYK